MKPVLVLQNNTGDGPAYLGQWLARQGIAMELRDSAAGDEFPQDLRGYSALAVLGGVMSVNDPLPSLRRAERLILQGLEREIPVLGHCLGGQLMAKAMGAKVGPSPAPEIGWQRMQVADNDAAASWFCNERRGREVTVFHWHYEAFDLPPGAMALAGSAACPHQAFGVGCHLAMQFHVEVDIDKVERWSREPSAEEELALARFPSVQTGAAMRQQAATALPVQQRLADHIYERWMALAGHGA